jgi:PGF-CTERM protein
MRRPLALLLAFAMVSSLVAMPVAAHGSHVRADPQVSDDGTLVVESMFSVNGGYLVVHRDQGDQPGRPVGVADIDSGARSNFEIQIDQQYWDEHEGNRTYWIVLHRDQNPDDGEFDPMVDSAVTGLHGSYVAARIPVGKSTDGPARVLAAEYNGQRTDSASVTLSRVQLNQPGYVVIQRVQSGAPAEVVGTRSLDAGTYDNLSVDIDGELFESMSVDDTQTVAATLHTSDGDGSFQPEHDTVVAPDGQPVRTFFSFSKVENASATTQPLINTPEGTQQRTPAETPGASETPGPPTESGSSTGTTPGFGVVATLVGMLLALFAVQRRRP